MCACSPQWAKMSQKSVTSVALFAPKAEINVFFYCACFKRVLTMSLDINKKKLISGIEVVLLFTLLHYFCHFFISLWDISVCVYDQL